MGGRWRGRKLKTPAGEAARPLRGRLREALFSILAADVPDARVLDLFAGTGAIGIEALSRGAAFAAFVEQNAAHARLIEENLAAAEPGTWAVHRGAATAVVARLAQHGERAFDIVYLGAPYQRGLTEPALRALAAAPGLLQPGAIVVAETQARESLDERYGALTLQRRRDYGVTSFWFFANLPEAAAARDAAPDSIVD